MLTAASAHQPFNLHAVVDFHQVAIANHSGARNPMDNLLVQADACHSGEGHTRARIAFEKRLCVMAREQRFYSSVDFTGRGARLGHLPAHAQRFGNDFACLPHEADFARRL